MPQWDKHQEQPSHNYIISLDLELDYMEFHFNKILGKFNDYFNIGGHGKSTEGWRVRRLQKFENAKVYIGESSTFYK